MTTHEERAARPDAVLRETMSDSSGDTADQADRLAMIMEAEAVGAAIRGESGEGSLDGYSYPLEDTDDVLAMEDADLGSDDPRHVGEPTRWQTAEEAAMHVQGEPQNDETLTPEDETLLGVDPYED
ncbi:MAG: hypothetical protein PHU75_04950 [Candidatus Nanopelagicales bacterium]|nr:hypothetical protein [Candidatus Nanopelagicales bacterium]